METSATISLGRDQSEFTYIIIVYVNVCAICKLNLLLVITLLANEYQIIYSTCIYNNYTNAIINCM